MQNYAGIELVGALTTLLQSVADPVQSRVEKASYFVFASMQTPSHCVLQSQVFSVAPTGSGSGSGSGSSSSSSSKNQAPAATAAAFGTP